MQADGRHPDRRTGDGAVGQFVVERARQNTRSRRLADASHPRKNPGLRDAGGFETVRDRTHHGVLADQVIEGRGTILAGKHAVGAVARRLGAEARIGLIRTVAHNAIRSAAPTRVLAVRLRE
jgi:hypothetical protein